MTKYFEKTPMINQYLEIKKKYPNTILFYQMGDFYEMFFEDARKASKILDITLTTRGKKSKQRVEMAGIPCISSEKYIEKLINRGISVAICNQINDSFSTGKLVSRKVVKVVTPSTVSENNLVSHHRNNILMSVFDKDKKLGIAYLNYTKGSITLKEIHLNEKNIIDEINRLHIKELLLSEKSKLFMVNILKEFNIPQQVRPQWNFNSKNSRLVLERTFNKKTLDVENIFSMKAAAISAGAIISFLDDTQGTTQNVYSIKLENTKNLIKMDSVTRFNLEIDESISSPSTNTLIKIMDRCETKSGKRLLKDWINNPIYNVKRIENRHGSIESILNTNLILPIKELLSGVHDLERISSRINLNTLKIQDLISLKKTLFLLPTIKKLGSNLNLSIYLKNLIYKIDDFKKLNLILKDSIDESNFIPGNIGSIIRSGFNLKLDHLRDLSQKSVSILINLEKEHRIKTKIPTLKFKFNNISGYYIEISKASLKKNISLPRNYEKKQTLKSCNRYITPELKSLENSILRNKIHILEEEKFTYINLVNEINVYFKDLQKASSIISELDVLVNFAERSMSLKLTRPYFSTKSVIEANNIRHLVVEKIVNNSFVSNDICLKNKKMQIITGPNMGGKSTYMRKIAHLVILAYCGSYVPASEAILGKIDGIFTRIGSSDDISKGCSTFMIEMLESAFIAKNATKDSLILVDEIGRGTNTSEGLSLAKAFAEYLALSRSFSLFSTHYTEICALCEKFPSIENIRFRAYIKNKNIIFSYKSERGVSTKSYSLEVARLAGLPDKIIENAYQTLKSFQKKDNVSKK